MSGQFSTDGRSTARSEQLAAFRSVQQMAVHHYFAFPVYDIHSGASVAPCWPRRSRRATHNVDQTLRR